MKARLFCWLWIAGAPLLGQSLAEGVAAIEAGRFDRAIQILSRVAERDANASDAHFYLGLAHFRAGLPGDARAPLGEPRSVQKCLHTFADWQRLKIPNSLHKMLWLPPNIIEEVHRVAFSSELTTSAVSDTEMVQRWVASAWLLTEKHVRSIGGHDHL
jgi:hypothetical protein